MSDDTWKQVKQGLAPESLTLGPYFAHQALHTPRHLLFTFARYKFAARLLPPEPCAVLELGCGEGMGTLLLAEGGHRVTGVDFDDEAIAHAQASVRLPHVSFRGADILGGRFGTFDAVVSLDVIEHVAAPGEEEFLRTACANLADDGFCLIGTPNETASRYASEASRIGHVNLFDAERLRALMARHFRHVFLFGANDEVVHTGFYPMCHYLLALGCGKRTAPGPGA